MPRATRCIAASILIYVTLDGFDLGVGILLGFTRDETSRLPSNLTAYRMISADGRISNNLLTES